MKIYKAYLFVCVLICAGFSNQPLDERKMQDILPKSKSKTWDILAKSTTSVDQKTYIYSIKFSQEVKNLQGKTINISGFMIPLEPEEKFKHFILSKRTPTCNFCPPGQPNEILEVFSEKPVAWDGKLINVSGTLELSENPENGMFFKLKDASLTK